MAKIMAASGASFKAHVFLDRSDAPKAVDLGMIPLEPIAPSAQITQDAWVQLTYAENVDFGRITQIEPSDWQVRREIPTVRVLLNKTV